MRKLTDHIVEGDSANHQLQIEVTDEPGAGGANHEYRIVLPEEVIPSASNFIKQTRFPVNFQNGAIKECGVNGVTHEALLAIVVDRLRSFQAGPYACDDNAEALMHTEKALECLQRRTRARIARGVEGTHTK